MIKLVSVKQWLTIATVLAASVFFAGPAAGMGETSCFPQLSFSGAERPDFDCRQGGQAAVTVTACIPEACPLTGALVEIHKTVAFCPGENWANCGGACGTATVTETLTIPPDQKCVSRTVNCQPPGNCGSCQVDINGYGIRRWESVGCPKPTQTPQPTATVTPLSTITPQPTATQTPCPTITPLPTATATSAPTSTPVPTATATQTPCPTITVQPTATPTPTVKVVAVLPKTGFPGEILFVIGGFGLAFKILSRFF